MTRSLESFMTKLNPYVIVHINKNWCRVAVKIERSAGHHHKDHRDITLKHEYETLKRIHANGGYRTILSTKIIIVSAYTVSVNYR